MKHITLVFSRFFHRFKSSSSRVVNSLRVFVVVAPLLLVSTQSLAATLEGNLQVVWGDEQDGSLAKINYVLTPMNSTQSFNLSISDGLVEASGGIAALQNTVVSIETDTPVPQPGIGPPTQPLQVNTLTIVEPPFNIGQSVSGAGANQQRRYVSIMCKFSDIPAEPQNLAYFQNMYGAAVGQLEHFWGEASSDNISVDQSTAHGWYTLPNPRSYYVNSGQMLDLLFNDCTQVADQDIDFTDVFGINLMFNDLLDCCAWGGGRFATLDGVTKVWPTTWEPPWGYANVSVMIHEMGHSFGLPHSNNADGDSNPYDNPWTPMSDAYDYAIFDGTYGWRGKHLNAYEKNRLGWFDPNETFVFGGTSQTILVDPINYYAANANAYRFARIPAGANGIDYYTVETRVNGTNGGDYDANLPASGVIIHSVDDSRSEPSWLVDTDVPPSQEGDGEGVIWRVGEEFIDTANDIRISIDAQIGDSFQITIGPVTASPPVTVTNLISPSGTTTNSTPTFVWESVADADEYKIVVVDRTTASTELLSSWQSASSLGCMGGGNCSYSPGLNFSGSLKWRVRARNSAGANSWSMAENFSSGTIPPTVVSLVEPSGSISTTVPSFTWVAVDYAEEYRIFVVDVPTGATDYYSPWQPKSSLGCNSAGQNCTFSPGETLAGSKKWRVQARNGIGKSSWSAATYFTSGGSVPGQVNTIDPTGSISTNNPTYTWTADPLADNYRLDVRNMDTGVVVISVNFSKSAAGCSSGTGTCSFTPGTSVTGNNRWWIQGRNGIGKGPWSAKRNFSAPAP